MTAGLPLRPARNLSVTVASGDALDVREFSVGEGMSRLFDVSLVAVSQSTNVDFEGCIGKDASFAVSVGSGRNWSGVCASIEQIGVEGSGLSTYAIHIVPTLWLLTQRRNYRVFQDKSELDIVLEVLGEWGISPNPQLDAGSYGKRRYRTQYAESDFDFVCRMLEDIGVAFTFQTGPGETSLVLCDAPNRQSPAAALPFVSTPNEQLKVPFVTAVRSGRHVRPGRYTQSDVDYRKPLNYPLAASASGGGGAEAQLERYHHNYGSFLWKGGGGGSTPYADDRGPARTDEGQGSQQVQKRLDAIRVEARVAHFRTTSHDLAPGNVMLITDHPREELAAPLLVVSGHFTGSATGDWLHVCEARYTDVDYRPQLHTPKPRTLGIESATVTGPSGEEIHTDEFGRVRVHFHWDRQGAADETSSCWVPVNQPWAGAGFGAISIPRVGQEVLVDFLGADPDRPVIVGRVFTLTTPPPYQLPKYKMIGGTRSETYPRPKGSSQAQLGGGPVRESARDESIVGGLADANLTRSGRAPAGGGVPVNGLGGMGLPGGGALAGAGGGTRPMPGPNANCPATQDQVNQNVQDVGSTSCGGANDHTLSANGVTHDDTAGNEILYLQGQRDIRLNAKNDMLGTVGHNRQFSVHGNDTEDVTGYQTTTVKCDRQVAVTGNQTYTVIQDINCVGMSNHIVTTKTDYYSETLDGQHTVKSKTKTLLTVGPSTLEIRPDAIVIDSPLVFINPGPVFMNALATGASAAEAQALAAHEAMLNAAADKVRAHDATAGSLADYQYRNSDLGTRDQLAGYYNDGRAGSTGLPAGADQTEALNRAGPAPK